MASNSAKYIPSACRETGLDEVCPSFSYAEEGQRLTSPYCSRKSNEGIRKSTGRIGLSQFRDMHYLVKAIES